MPEHAYVYILANGFKKLYIGITADLQVRVRQHQQKQNPDCRTAKYNIAQLVYFERFTTITAAIHREKVLKGWLRIRKLELIVSTNQPGATSAPTGANQSSSTKPPLKNPAYRSHHPPHLAAVILNEVEGSLYFAFVRSSKTLSSPQNCSKPRNSATHASFRNPNR